MHKVAFLNAVIWVMLMVLVLPSVHQLLSSWETQGWPLEALSDAPG